CPAELISNPGGKLPDTRLHVNGDSPPAACNETSYEAPATATGSGLLVRITGEIAAMTSPKCLEVTRPALSVTEITSGNTPDCKVAPESTPCAVNSIPEGKTPSARLQL